jgi:hypothetical protein
MIVIYLEGLPLLYPDIMNTEVQFGKVDYGIHGITNSSNYKHGVPISKLYQKIANTFGKKLGIDVSLVDLEAVVD